MADDDLGLNVQPKLEQTAVAIVRHTYEFCPIESVKAIFGKTCQILANLGSLKCDPYVKHLFLW